MAQGYVWQDRECLAITMVQKVTYILLHMFLPIGNRTSGIITGVPLNGSQWVFGWRLNHHYYESRPQDLYMLNMLSLLQMVVVAAVTLVCLRVIHYERGRVSE